MKPKVMMRDGETMPRVGMGGISQALIDRVHILVNLERAAKGKEPADFSQPILKPKLWRKRSAEKSGIGIAFPVTLAPPFRALE